MTTISALPTPPSTTDPANFDARADAFLAALPTFQAETNAVATEVNNANTTAQGAAVTATAAASLATATAGAALYNSGISYTQWQAAISAVNGRLYRRNAAGSGGADPANNDVSVGGPWVDVGLPYITPVTDPGAVTLQPGLAYEFTTGTVSVSLPASPAVGTVIGPITKSSASAVITVLRNGSTINGVADDALVDVANRDFYFRCKAANAWLVRAGS